MALINCPECNTAISNKAEKCPSCGYPIFNNPKPPIVVKKSEGCFLQTLNIGCAAILILIILLVASATVGSMLFKKHQSKNENKSNIHNNSKGGSR